MIKRRLSILAWTFIALALAACAESPSPTPGIVTVDILFLNHAPVREVLTQVDAVLATYGDQVSVTRYDVDTPEGASFAKQKGLAGHVPLAIFVSGVQTFDVNGRQVTFESFPHGAGTGMVPDGAWAVADLESVLQSIVKK